MQKICKQCCQNFEITSEDLKFYEKLSPVFNGKKYLIPPPNLCFNCRQQRRLAYRNERFMYKRKSDFTGKNIISMYPPDSPFKIYEQEIWWSDKWDAMKYGRDFDFSRSFFDQFRELQLQVPRVALVNKHSENSIFTNHSGKNKNCYMSSVTFDSENIFYSDWVIKNCKDCVDSSYLNEGSELCYETYYAWGSYMTFYCEFIKRCQNVWFCYDCINCKNCFMCWNLRNKEYCIRNKQYSKKDYEIEINKILQFRYSEIEKFKLEYIKSKKTIAIHQATYSIQAIDSSGDLLFYTKNCNSCFDCINMEDCKYCIDAIDTKDCMDVYHVGWAELMCECHAISNGYNCLFCHFTYDNRNSIYCDCTQNCNNCFGCAGLNQKQYCILNKQYSKEEYNILVPKIIEHMSSYAKASEDRQNGAVPHEALAQWGEFFPINFSPFAYNQSRAPEYYPLNHKNAINHVFTWSDYEPEFPHVEKTIPANLLPETINEIPDDILNWAILPVEICDSHISTNHPFKIIKSELDFYRKMNLPIPRKHPDQRYLDRISLRNPRKLWRRKCIKCEKEIFSTYSPEREELVYCEMCYLEDIY
ncbi:MAG: hypothetical protein UR28_C0002G0041 [Candidatus Peregrinibacteria bacterium GW2011_GWF2_33_10]|nr:MAG: hypothetical protein UR28_C0002G0041 [Candidatus Peregrinibacteria bacterium GW2011_GWF2_33_10]OGJ45293.1 MAG: hypothetical protein A2272_02200 [Candidatus Peregrinibacteria bacterium RIFOXYA12_FULL_33_12]OGJ45619.1 MAG: hypothetical protein A2263_00780 [Candidatus Peregrinibacteria bacterium RIFOXYA2_FULL_33_21]OGJ51210.1 MAG: hypothetical protein A2307_01160 [Candidatus Peregrinibacteria bacterium RIFOXYB2_FULL_33_20]